MSANAVKKHEKVKKAKAKFDSAQMAVRDDGVKQLCSTQKETREILIYYTLNQIV